jgi:hypothetical protein
VVGVLLDGSDYHPRHQPSSDLLRSYPYYSPRSQLRSAGCGVVRLRYDSGDLGSSSPLPSLFHLELTSFLSQNIIQVWVTSNIVERKDRRNQQRWKIYSAVVTAVLGPGVRTDKYRKGERVVSWKRVLWGTILPFGALCWCTSAALLCQQYSARYHGGGGTDLGAARLDSSIRPASTKSFTSLPDLDSTAGVRIMVLVTSSWTNRSLTNRHTFRETSVRLFPRSSPSFSVSYRFLLGAAPSPQTAARSGPGIEAESNEFGDMLVVPAHDDYEHLSQKIYEGWKWASELDVDYVFKTDDDILLRMDVLAKEFVQLGRRREYWKGFAYWCVSVSPLLFSR